MLEVKTVLAESKPHRRLVLIDGYGFVFRAYYGLPPMTAPDGTATGAIFGFLSMMLKLLTELPASHIAVALDSGSKTFRNDIYQDYKANRAEAPADLKQQFPIIRDAAKALNLPVLEANGYEADDIIAALTHQAIARNEHVVIVSSDKDLMQLIGPQVRMFDPLKSKFITEIEVAEKFFVTPDKVLDVLSLIGDVSDNIPGVPGIGPKTAAELINDFGSLDNLLEGFARIKQDRRRQMLSDHQETARLSRQLLRLAHDMPLSVEFDSLVLRSPQPQLFFDFIHKFGFKRLLPRAEKFFAIEAPPSKQSMIIKDSAQLKTWLDMVRLAGQVAIFIQTEPAEGSIIAIAMSVNSGDCCYIPVARSQGLSLLDRMDKQQPGLDLTTIITAITPILQDESISKIGHDMKNIMKLLGCLITNLEDLMLLSYIQNNSLAQHDLPALCEKYLGMQLTGIEELVGSGKNKLPLWQVPQETLARFVTARSDAITKLYHIINSEVKDPSLYHLYQQIEKPLITTLLKMEQKGIKLDIYKLRLLSDEFAARIRILETQIFRLAGQEFNIGSPKQMADVLYGSLGLASGKMSKTGNYSTGAEILEELHANGSEIAGLILDWRHLSKLKGTYTDALQKQVDPTSSRIHTTFSMASTSTGRLSSSDPNLQNIPIRTEDGNKIREAFIAEKGHKLISADYSQIELRVLAHVADIATLKNAFIENKDIHVITASQIFGVSLAEVDSAMRRRAKAINFGIIYGISAFGLARQLGIDQHEASNYIKAYFREYPGIQSYMEATKEAARSKGYVTTIMGRRCYIKNINDKNAGMRGFAERLAINAPIQGSAADIIKKAMYDADQAIVKAKLSTAMILQVHDELLFEAPEHEVDIAQDLIKNCMEHTVKLSVPLIVDANAGNSWAEIH